MAYYRPRKLNFSTNFTNWTSGLPVPQWDAIFFFQLDDLNESYHWKRPPSLPYRECSFTSCSWSSGSRSRSPHLTYFRVGRPGQQWDLWRADSGAFKAFFFLIASYLIRNIAWLKCTRLLIGAMCICRRHIPCDKNVQCLIQIKLLHW